MRVKGVQVSPEVRRRLPGGGDGGGVRAGAGRAGGPADQAVTGGRGHRGHSLLWGRLSAV